MANFSVNEIIQQATNTVANNVNDATASSVSSILNNSAAVPQLSGIPVSDISKADPSTKIAEAAEKMSNLSNKSFDKLTNQINLTSTASGVTYITDAATGKVYSELSAASEDTAFTSNSSSSYDDNTEEFKVKIWTNSGGIEGAIILYAMPSISEGRSAEYETMSPLHHPGEILKYKTTSTRDWDISTKLFSRNETEAAQNLILINTIRSWVMPYYGTGTESNIKTGQFLGAPPPLLKFQAYGTQTIGPVPCVLSSYKWDWPNDVDYIHINPDTVVQIYGEDNINFRPNAKTPFPVLMSISLTLRESYSPAEFSGFDLIAYREGNLGDSHTPVRI